MEIALLIVFVIAVVALAVMLRRWRLASTAGGADDSRTRATQLEIQLTERDTQLSEVRDERDAARNELKDVRDERDAARNELARGQSRPPGSHRGAG